MALSLVDEKVELLAGSSIRMRQHGERCSSA
jgi:hypothetical protein